MTSWSARFRPFFQQSYLCSVQFRKLVSHVTTAGSAKFDFLDADLICDEGMFDLCAELHVQSMCFFDGHLKIVHFINPMGIESLRRAASITQSTESVASLARGTAPAL